MKEFLTKDKRNIVFDIEANGLLNPDKIWCIVCKDIDTKEEFLFYPDTCKSCGGTGIDEFFGNSDICTPCLECNGEPFLNSGCHKDFEDKFLNFMYNEVGTIIGHNILGYDLPVLEKLLNFSWPLNKTLDTLVLSRLFRPVSPPKFQKINTDNRNKGHSLEAWGVRLGIYKGDFKEFSIFSKEMLNYCIQDVNVNLAIWEELKKESVGFSNDCILLEHKVAKMLKKQEDNGFFLDRREADGLLETTTELLEDMLNALQELFPPKKVVKKILKLTYNKDGTIPKRIIKQLDKYEYNTVVDKKDGSISYELLETVEFNPSSPKQVVERLLELGWKPTKFTPKGSPSVDKEAWPAILETYKNIPAIQKLALYNIVADRNQKVLKWIELSEIRGDGRVHGKVNPIGAATHRCSHYDDNMANIASVKTKKILLEDFKKEFPDKWDTFKEFEDIDSNKVFLHKDDKKVEVALKGIEGVFGWESRSCWSAPTEDTCIIGCDASGIQLRALAHYMNEPEYTRKLIEEDIHEVNRQAAGIKDRPTAKTFIYAWLLGAGDLKIGNIVGIKDEKEENKLIYWAKNKKTPYPSNTCSNLLEFIIEKIRKKGEKATKTVVVHTIKGLKTKQQFVDRTPALKRLRFEDIPKATKKGYIIGLDGRKLWIPNEHLAMSLYLQGFEAVIMKKAMEIYHEELEREGIPFKQVAFVHDEFQVEAKKEFAVKIGETMEKSFRKAGEYYNVNCPLDGEYKIGRNWAQTH